jgi:hypothetical protein
MQISWYIINAYVSAALEEPQQKEDPCIWTLAKISFDLQSIM